MMQLVGNGCKDDAIGSEWLKDDAISLEGLKDDAIGLESFALHL